LKHIHGNKETTNTCLLDNERTQRDGPQRGCIRICISFDRLFSKDMLFVVVEVINDLHML